MATNKPEFRTIPELLEAYSKGQRKFTDWDFQEDGSVAGMDLSGIEFDQCFLFLDFRGANLTGSKFTNCNIKTADFRDANMTNALVKNCAVESVMFAGAIIENFRFEENYCYGAIATQEDFYEFIKDYGEDL